MTILTMGGFVKSVQLGKVDIASGNATGTATLSPSVIVANSVVLFNGLNTDGTGAKPEDSLCYVVLTNSTTVTATRNTGAVAQSPEVQFTVIEFHANRLRNKQSGIIIHDPTETTDTATLSPAITNLSKAALFYGGVLSSDNRTSHQVIDYTCRIFISDVNTVTSVRKSGSYAIHVAWTMIEFY